MSAVRASGRRLVALDIDGTVMHEDGTITDAVTEAITRLAARGDEVMLATGRSPSSTLPVVARLGIAPEYVVCCNGAVTLRRDPEGGYRTEIVETFDPTDVLETIRRSLPAAHYAVEDADGAFFYTEAFPGGAVMGAATTHVPFEELLGRLCTRVVVISPETGIDEFTTLVEEMGLHQVSYAIGWTAWLDIAPHGVNKSTALEIVRQELGIERSDVVALGDGRNDIEMLTWAAEEGAGLAMGQAPDEVRAVASAVIPTVHQDGVAVALSALR
ncbi:HAD family hydrolase [Rathayibacter tanaceti]|uniref:HAD-IIB family hydrolase n=2 Tax=Rathayibacter tanaceti TaxID=1671680 RepID=A0A166HRH5_9MICO|nr:HAD family hydrolase [Rathayibacter tanaceti]KZX21053.1 Sugar phosphatase YidA [Rathayibacter tanaceti]QHC56332.1 HAD-IIB family hydrolase [Rathayibacter tanaceti]TCO34855.1 Cof subfamily protein (haloacid dehalogenase superfamily)/HAD superfamily hydrolase (TIGR01484 family) [Rathayibacter tanaceti]